MPPNAVHQDWGPTSVSQTDGVTPPDPPRMLVEQFDPDEKAVAWGSAKWRENPYQDSAEEAKGLLCLTTSRIIFETSYVQPFVSLELRSFEAAEVTTKSRGVQLVLTHRDGERKTFWCDTTLAEQIAAAI